MSTVKYAQWTTANRRQHDRGHDRGSGPVSVPGRSPDPPVDTAAPEDLATDEPHEEERTRAAPATLVAPSAAAARGRSPGANRSEARPSRPAPTPSHRCFASVRSRGIPRGPGRGSVGLPFFARGSAHNFGPISINLTGEYAPEPFFIGLEECRNITSKSILAVRCH
jgi:hypothetical protein